MAKSICFCCLASAALALLIMLDNFLRTGRFFEYWQLLDLRLHHEHIALLLLTMPLIRRRWFR